MRLADDTHALFVDLGQSGIQTYVHMILRNAGRHFGVRRTIPVSPSTVLPWLSQGGRIFGVTVRVGRYFPGSAGFIDDLLFHVKDSPRKIRKWSAYAVHPPQACPPFLLMYKVRWRDSYDCLTRVLLPRDPPLNSLLRHTIANSIHFVAAELCFSRFSNSEQ